MLHISHNLKSIDPNFVSSRLMAEEAETRSFNFPSSKYIDIDFLT